jgi:hypothetical protein
MAIEHKLIPDAQLHEPKGIVSALSGTVYTANGGGSGSWQLPKIQGQAVAGANSVPVSDGFGGVVWSVLNAPAPSLLEAEYVNTGLSLTTTPQMLSGFVVSQADPAGNITMINGNSRLVVGEAGYYSIIYEFYLSPNTALGASSERVIIQLLENGNVPLFPSFKYLVVGMPSDSATADSYNTSFVRNIYIPAGTSLEVNVSASDARSYTARCKATVTKLAV